MSIETCSWCNCRFDAGTLASFGAGPFASYFCSDKCRSDSRSSEAESNARAQATADAQHAAHKNLESAQDRTWRALEVWSVESKQGSRGATLDEIEQIKGMTTADSLLNAMLSAFEGDALDARIELITRYFQFMQKSLEGHEMFEPRRRELQQMFASGIELAQNEPQRRRDVQVQQIFNSARGRATWAGTVAGLVLGPVVGWRMENGFNALSYALGGLIVAPIVLGLLPRLTSVLPPSQAASACKVLTFAIPLGVLLVLFT